MNRLNKIAVSLLVSVFLLVLVGLGGVASEKISLKIIMPTIGIQAEKTYLTGLIAEYNQQNPNVEVELTEIPYDGYFRKITTSFAAGSPWDIMWTPTWQWNSWRDFLVSAPAEVKEWFLDNKPFKLVKDAVVRDGELIALPYELTGLSNYYNVGMFEEAGLNRAPVTWEELIDFSKKLTKFDSTGKMIQEGYAIRYAGAAGVLQKWAPFVWSNGGEYLLETEEGWKVAWDTPEVREAFQLMVDMVYKYKVSSITFPFPSPAFGEGLAAMHYRESWVIEWMKENNPSIEVGIAPVVVRKYMVTVYPPNTFTVAKESSHQKEAWQFLQFFLSPENQSGAAQIRLMLPWSSKMADDAFYRERPIPYSVTMRNLLYARTEDDGCPHYAEIREVFFKHLERALHQEISVSDFLSAAKKEVEGILK